MNLNFPDHTEGGFQSDNLAWDFLCTTSEDDANLSDRLTLRPVPI